LSGQYGTVPGDAVCRKNKADYIVTAILRIVENLDSGFGDLCQIETLDKGYNGLQQGVRMTGFVSDDRETQGTELPFVLVFNFRYRNIKFTADSPKDAFHHLTFCFQ
jgi:hypothetical protein